MKEEYHFSKSVKNPHAPKLKRQITISIDIDTVNYFQMQSEISGIPYQTLMSLYLSDCAKQQRQLYMNWR